MALSVLPALAGVLAGPGGAGKGAGRDGPPPPPPPGPAPEEEDGMMESLDPIPPAERTWNWVSFALLWVAMTINPMGMVLGSSLVDLGLGVGAFAGALSVAIAVLLAGFLANSVAGAKYGVPFPVYARAAFGVRGALWVALLRGVVGVVWLGLQAWFGAGLIYNSLLTAFPGLAAAPALDLGRTNVAEMGIFLAFVAVHAGAVLVGLKRVERLLKVASPVQVVGLAAMAGWALAQQPPAESLGRVADMRSPGGGDVHFPFGMAVTALVSAWSTLILNVADLSRYAQDQRSQLVGQAVGFPAAFFVTVFSGLLVCGAAYARSGEVAWNLAPILRTTPAWFALPVGASMAVGVLSVNVLANIISPANDVINICPERISFKAAALGSLALAVVSCPWRTLADPHSFVDTFLVGYGMLTGALFGIMSVDFFALRKRELDVAGLYARGPRGPYHYVRGFRLKALLAQAVALALLLPGFLAELGLARVPAALEALYELSWFTSTIVGAAVYALVAWGDGGKPRVRYVELGSGGGADVSGVELM